MTSINRLDRALSTLRQVLAERTVAHKPVLRQDVPELNQAEKSDRSKQIKQRIKKGLAALDLTQSSDQERGASVFLETVLADEFGSELLADPAFYNLLSDVRNSMLADQNTRRDMVSMLVELKGSD